MFYFLSLFWILSISGLLTIVFKRKFEMVCTISILFGALVLYFFGFINHIRIGFYITFVFVLLFYAILIKWIIKKEYEKLIEFKDNFLGFGLIWFILFSIYCFVLYKYQGFSNCDEFTHWGPMLKETIRLDGFYSQTDSKLIMHKDYPPLFTLIETLYMGFNGFKFHEPYAYVALVTFMFSMFLPVLSNLSIKNKKDYLKSLIFVTCIVLVGLTLDKTSTASDYAFVYNSIYVDWCLALFCAYGLYMTYKEKDWGLFRFVSLGLILVSFVLMKQMGLVFYIIVLFYAFIKVLFIDKLLDKKMLIKGALILIVLPILFYLSWKYIVSLYNIDGQFKIGDLSIKEFINIIQGNTELTWKYEAFRNYCSNLLHRPIVLHPFEMSYFTYVLLMIALINIIFWFKKDGIYLSLVYLIGAVGYSVAMLLLYTLAFGIDEAPYLASFDRYMVSYLYCGTCLVLMLAIDRLYESYIKSFVILIVLYLFIEPKSFNYLVPKTSVIDNYKMTITVVKQWDNGTEFEREDLNGLRIKFHYLDYLYDDENSYNKFVDALKQDDGLYVIGYDNNVLKFWEEMGEDDYLFNMSYYKIEKENGKMTISWDAFSFLDYVIIYYSLGI